MRVSRRALIVGAGAAALGSAAPLRRSFADSEIKEYRLTAKQAVVNLTGNGYPDTAVWSYDGSVPGPKLHIRQGDRVRLVVNNKLGEETTVHWHGIRLPNAMDGVPGITQPSIRPGESFIYEFIPPDAGTFWYHPHADTLQQLGRGLSWRFDRRGARAGPGRSRPVVGDRGLAARRRRTDHARLRQPHGSGNVWPHRQYCHG
jgi:FtsP/CotA-like multicopper oxidase with cupredoxin domain